MRVPAPTEIRHALIPTLFAAWFCAVPFSLADDKAGDHKHEHKHEHGDGHAHEKKKAGPNGGRVVHELGLHLEFLVLKDRRVQITFLDEDLKPAAAGRQVAKVYAGSRQSPAVLGFDKKGDVLISDQPLPKGDNFPVVLQVKARPIAKYATAKFNCDLRECPTCDHLEYACTCDHHHD